jgi:hypothetical protein
MRSSARENVIWNFQKVEAIWVDHCGRTGLGMKCLSPPDRGFESHSKHRCLCEFILFYCPVCVSRGIASG